MLADKNFKYRYSTGSLDEPIDFCELALSNSVSLSLGLGYFSSACFNILSTGFARFINNGGIMKLYINQSITEEDYNVLKSNQVIDFDSRLLQSFESLKNILTKRDSHFFKCLSFLIQSNRIEIKIVVPKEGGIAHQKFGIFNDEVGNSVSFTGSMNFTAAALLRNIETIECSCSWKGQDSFERIELYKQDFDSLWLGENQMVDVYEAKQFCNEIVKMYPEVDKDELLVQELELIKKIKNRKNEFQDNAIRTIAPHFPYKYEEPMPYQTEAFNAWINNNKCGIFAMATGTGKTVTSLNCALQEYLADGFYQLLILVPTKALVQQWLEEVSCFDFGNVITVSSDSDWKGELIKLRTKLRKNKGIDYVIISTYSSFTSNEFLYVLKQMPDTMLLIADEAHNIGAPTVLKAFEHITAKRRIALSATPNRIYDELGTLQIGKLFNDQFPYTYNYSMSKAIADGKLMNYCYYPKLVHLNEDEMEKYAEYSKKLMVLYDSTTNKFKNQAEAEKILMLRKQVLHKANDKLRVLKNIIEEIGEDKLKYCFLYVPEGSPNASNSGIDDNTIMQNMLNCIVQTFPSVTCNTFTSANTLTERANLLKGFENGQINVLLAMKCLDEGVDVPRAEYGIIASSTCNPCQFIQRRGRLLRKHPNKTFAYIYDMVVAPNFKSSYYSEKFYQMEKNLVKSELMRVAYFASLASNYDSLSNLEELVEFYNINIDEIILSVNQ